ncbi:MAG: hypothetical protein ACJA2F_001223 [Nitriliruptoraceae bacterium]|jgi:hypothetical protein
MPVLVAFVVTLPLAGCAPAAHEFRILHEALPKAAPIVAVVGTFSVAIVPIDAGRLLGFPDHAPTDDATVQATAQQVATLLDQHLDAVQNGAPTLAVLGAEWVADAADGTQAALTTDLARTENPITSATYTMQVQVEQAPTLVIVAVTVVRFDGTTAAVDLIFDVTGARPTLQLASGGTA